MSQSLTRKEYLEARRLYRDNGRYSLRWMSDEARAVFEQLEHGKDWLAERASIVAYCRRAGISYNVRHTQALR